MSSERQKFTFMFQNSSETKNKPCPEDIGVVKDEERNGT